MFNRTPPSTWNPRPTPVFTQSAALELTAQLAEQRARQDPNFPRELRERNEEQLAVTARTAEDNVRSHLRQEPQHRLYREDPALRHQLVTLPRNRAEENERRLLIDAAKREGLPEGHPLRAKLGLAKSIVRYLHPDADWRTVRQRYPSATLQDCVRAWERQNGIAQDSAESLSQLSQEELEEIASASPATGDSAAASSSSSEGSFQVTVHSGAPDGPDPFADPSQHSQRSLGVGAGYAGSPTDQFDPQPIAEESSNVGFLSQDSSSSSSAAASSSAASASAVASQLLSPELPAGFRAALPPGRLAGSLPSPVVSQSGLGVSGSPEAPLIVSQTGETPSPEPEDSQRTVSDVGSPVTGAALAGTRLVRAPIPPPILPPITQAAIDAAAQEQRQAGAKLGAAKL